MVRGKPLVPVQLDIEKYLSQTETVLARDKAVLARDKAVLARDKAVLAWAKADMSREPHTKVYLLGLMSMRKS
jgi:hypothetical protein